MAAKKRAGKHDEIPAPPAGAARLRWIGPGFLWMASAAGSGELLFTPRIGALYGYTLMWALLAAVALKWAINREVGRLAVVTGAPVLTAAAERGWVWAPWVILVPQLAVAVSTIAGLAGSAANALALALPGDVRVWTVVAILTSTALVGWGRYSAVERAATVVGVALGLAAIAAAAAVKPDVADIATGLVPRLPPETDLGEVLPWLGFLLSGAAGMLWYSYWLAAKGYGAAGSLEPGDPPRAAESLSSRDTERLRGWVGQMTMDNTTAVVGTLIVTVAFLVLGTEMLRPKGLVPEEDSMAEVLGRMLGDVWGPVGFWFMVLGVFLGFWDTVLSDQDGFGRMYASGLGLLFGRRLPAGWRDEERLKRAFVIVVLTAIPIALYLMVGRPVRLLQIAGVIEAAHIPVVAAIVLLINRRALPAALRPGAASVVVVSAAVVFFAAFALFYVATLAGLEVELG